MLTFLKQRRSKLGLVRKPRRHPASNELIDNDVRIATSVGQV